MNTEHSASAEPLWRRTSEGGLDSRGLQLLDLIAGTLGALMIYGLLLLVLLGEL